MDYSSDSQDTIDQTFYALEAARKYGAEIAREYQASSPTYILAAFVEGLNTKGEVVSIGQLLQNSKVTDWRQNVGASDRQLRVAINAARKARRAQASATTGVVVPPTRRKRTSEQSSSAD